MAWAVEMASNWYLCPLVCEVVAMSIEVDVEGVLYLPNVLLSALPAVIQVDHVPCLAGGRSSYVECLVSGCTSVPVWIWLQVRQRLVLHNLFGYCAPQFSVVAESPMTI